MLLCASSARLEASEPERPTPFNRSAEQPAPPPFSLTSDEQKDVDRLLDRWEQWNSRLKTFDCRFKRWTYDLVFGPRDKAAFIDLGVIQYAAPNRSLYRVETTEKNGKDVPVENARMEHWICDGKSIFVFDPTKTPKQFIEHKLPTETEGNHLVDGPLSFGIPGALFSRCFLGAPLTPYPFGAKAAELKQRYYIRAITPPDRHDEIWLEARPRSRQLAAQHQEIQLIFTLREMSPSALKIVQPNGKDYTVYQFFDVLINGSPSRATDDPFHPTVPLGWQEIVEELPAELVRYPRGDGQR
jgi:TIGR03009 family protein